jgi:hypothetical protein
MANFKVMLFEYYVLFSKEIGLIDDSGIFFEDFTGVGVFPETDK